VYGSLSHSSSDGHATRRTGTGTAAAGHSVSSVVFLIRAGADTSAGDDSSARFRRSASRRRAATPRRRRETCNSVSISGPAMTISLGSGLSSAFD
jgi:hypothetical protein